MGQLHCKMVPDGCAVGGNSGLCCQDKRFGNARRVRKYVDEIIKQQNLRLSKDHTNDSRNYQSLIKKVDVDLAIERIDDQYVYSRDKIGF